MHTYTHARTHFSFSREMENTALRFQELVTPERSINAGTRTTRGKIKRNYTLFAEGVARPPCE